MKIIVIGASGTMGRRVADRLEAAGAQVVRAHRGTGVDAQTGEGLAQAIAGADVVVDCLNVATVSTQKAVAFFDAAADHIADAANAAGARVVCLSICNAADPAVNRKMGYYKGKAHQESVYRARLADDRLTIVRTTQWFELAETMSDQFSLGRIALMPRMVTAPIAADDGADVIAAVALGTEFAGASSIEVRGPDRVDLVDVARAVRGGRGKVFGLRFGGPALTDGSLIPREADVVTETTLAQWLAAR